jgi:FtsH-binding integral membrane protein
MRKLYIGVLAFNLIFEGLVGLILVFKIDPGGEDALQIHSAWATDYGFAALVIASLIFWVWRQRYNEQTATLVLGILTSFHIGLTLSTGMAVADGDPIAAAITHGLMAILSFTLFITRKQWILAQEPLHE